jgi:hypothetical protein
MSASDIIAVRAPEYSTYLGLDGFISLADSQTGTFDNAAIGTLGTTRDLAVALRALHMITKQIYRDGAKDGSGEGIGGNVSLDQEGQLKRMMDVDPSLMKKWPDLVTTTWGMELIGLIKSGYGLVAMTRRSVLNPIDLAGEVIGL